MRRTKRACLSVTGLLAMTGAFGVATAVQSQAATVHSRCTTVAPPWAPGGIEACQDWLWSADKYKRSVVKPLPKPDLGCTVFSEGGSRANDPLYWYESSLALSNVGVGHSTPSVTIRPGDYQSAACFGSQPWRLASSCKNLRAIAAVYPSGSYTDPMYLSVPCG
jgi:hypothetical protein